MYKDVNQDLPSAVAHVCRLYDVAVGLRQAARFGEAINVFNKAADEAEALLTALSGEACREACFVSPDAFPEDIKNALLQICSRAKASVELLQEINGFVNTDLMNP